MKWFDLPKLSAREFTYQNSGRKEGEAPPYWIEKDGELKSWFAPFQPIGWTESSGLPFKPDYPCIAIMFEDEDFNKVWWHYLDPRDENHEEEPLPEGFVLEPEDDGMGEWGK